jgi:hypothetical protein
MDATQEATELTADQRAALALAYGSNAIGAPLTLDCHAVARFGRDRAERALGELKARKLVYKVRDSEDSWAGWCLTAEGDRVAAPLYAALHEGLLGFDLPEPDPLAGKYGTVTTTGKQFHDGEPVFVLRSTDPHAPAAVRLYANRCGMAGATVAHVRECHAIADRMEAWQKANPALVKVYPD